MLPSTYQRNSKSSAQKHNDDDPKTKYIRNHLDNLNMGLNKDVSKYN